MKDGAVSFSVVFGYSLTFLDVLPIGTKLNLSDLNTKKLSQARRQFILNFLGVARLSDEGEVKERVGEQEYLDSVAADMWKQRIQNVARWNKNRTHKLVQCAMMLEVISIERLWRTKYTRIG